ncbi:hypothetical protein [Paenibacillus koleovorans]|uniref:hypothetical protein n=1 Tax=Paenibacillus koleovorans TaxID=121608 RepID=UPI000FD819B4|nr:hypothetical protein [Paenibacillus koleovorans]
MRTTYDFMLERFILSVDKELAKFDPASGRLLETDGGWAVTHQDIMLSMALLYLTPHPANRYCGDAAFLEQIGRVGDAYRAFQYEDGKVEFVKIDGSRWGPIYMPWSMYHWLETCLRLESHMDSERLASWREGLLLGFEGMYLEQRGLLEQLRRDPAAASGHAIHNIPTWNAMALHRAAGMFGKPEWKADADAMMRAVVEYQHPDGYWPEHGGPTPLYNLVYVHALGLYRLHGGEVDTLPALRRAFAFTRLFMYPDSTLVETIDGRCKYDHAPFLVGLPGILQAEGGRAWIADLVKSADADAALMYRPHFAELLRYWPEALTEEVADAEGMQPSADLQSRTVLANAWVVREHGWYFCLSGFTREAVESRWGMDRQSFIGIWHEQAGLIVGGGNSKNQPEWSTFDVTGAGGFRQYVPDAGEALAGVPAVRLRYGTRHVTIALLEVTASRVELEVTASLEADDSGVLRLPLQHRADGQLAASFASAEADGNQTAHGGSGELHAEAGEGRQRISGQGWTAWAEGPLRLDWPSFPFNPYAMDGSSDLEHAIAVLAIPLESLQPKRIVVSLEPFPYGT